MLSAFLGSLIGFAVAGVILWWVSFRQGLWYFPFGWLKTVIIPDLVLSGMIGVALPSEAHPEMFWAPMLLAGLCQASLMVGFSRRRAVRRRP